MTSPSGRPRVLLGHLVSNGDVLYATAVARQIKNDFPGCHLTWAIGSTCRGLLTGNPYVDAVWEVPYASQPPPTFIETWHGFRHEAERRRATGEFDQVYYTQILPDNARFYDGMIRSSIFRGYPRPITVPVAPVLRLEAAESERVRRFAEEAGLPDGGNVVLFECAPRSGQSIITPALALDFSREIVARSPGTRVILSSNVPVTTDHPHILDASGLTLRENAALTHHCTLLIGCSSGITWISTSEAAKPLPMIQLLNRDAVWFNSVRRDFERWNLPVQTVIEIEDAHADRVPDCVQAVFAQGFAAARQRFHEDIPRNYAVHTLLQGELLREGKWRQALTMLRVNFRAHGLRPAFLGSELRWLGKVVRTRLQNVFKRRPA